MLCLMLISTQQIAMQGKPNSTEHVRTFDIFTSINGEDWRKEKPLLPKVGTQHEFCPSVMLYKL